MEEYTSKGSYLSSYIRPTGVLCAKEKFPLSLAAAADDDDDDDEEEEEEAGAGGPRLTSSLSTSNVTRIMRELM